MSVVSEVEKRLAETEKRIAVLVQHLRRHAELEDSLRTAGSGLQEVRTELERLAESATVANESLAAALAAFREAVELTRRSDPARIMEAVARVEERLAGTENRVERIVGEAAGLISTRQEKAEQQLEARAEERLARAEGRVKKTIDEAAGAISRKQEKAERQLEKEARTIREAVPTTAVYITLAVALALLGFQILPYFFRLLSG